MEQHTELQEVTYHHEPTGDTKRIWRTFWLLLIITVIELALGWFMYAVDLPGWLELFIKGVIVILSLAKAFYIVSIFMHLGDEIRNLIMTIVVPLMLFIWFIAAFLWDGNEYRVSRNKYDPYFKERTMTRELRVGDTTSTPGALK
ncbi:MAG TPA: cytochrome C oxidase subunit IV family protein [Chitinophagaceae bacterium]|jgi:cytochrome c oxidase subunit IV|nr:cytochrome C oxidase subunit IV family protein [Chitinophagaceae bacterium]